jgi:hypothetical protein
MNSQFTLLLTNPMNELNLLTNPTNKLTLLTRLTLLNLLTLLTLLTLSTAARVATDGDKSRFVLRLTALAQQRCLAVQLHSLILRGPGASHQSSESSQKLATLLLYWMDRILKGTGSVRLQIEL